MKPVVTAVRQKTSRSRSESGSASPSGSVPPVIEAFDELARLTCEAADPRVITNSVADKFRALVEVDRCAIFLQDEDPGLFRVGTWLGRADYTARLRGMVNGPDPYTAEILERREPVVITNSRADPRVAQHLDVTLKCRVHSMIGVPISVADDVTAVAYLDNEGTATKFTTSQLKTALQFASLAGAAMKQSQILHDVRQQLTRSQQQNKVTHRLYVATERLDELVRQDAPLSHFADLIASLTNRPVAIYDATWRKPAEAHPTAGTARGVGDLSDTRLRSHPRVQATIERLAAGEVQLIPPLPALGLDLRCMVVPILLGPARWGHLVLHEAGRPFDKVDRQIATSASSRLGVSLSSSRLRSANHGAVGVLGDLREALLDDLLKSGLPAGSIARRAEAAGIGNGPHRVCVFGGIRRGPVPEVARELLRDLEMANAAGPVLQTECDGRLVSLVPVATDATGTSTTLDRTRELVFAAAADNESLRNLVVGVSRPITALSDCEKAYREARHVLRAMQRFENPQLPRLVVADEIGAGLMFLSSADVAEACAFAREHLGTLVATGEHPQVVATLRTFLRTGNVASCARALQVHENTVRYRLSKVENLTGLNVLSDPDAQIKAAMAMLVLRFTGECDWHDEPPASA